MQTINIAVRNKIAVNTAQDCYVCGNSDYIVHFVFDEEWNDYSTKTARFVKDDGGVYDVVFTGSDCPVPIIENTFKLHVGVYAGNLCTTTAAYVPCKKSILCGGGVHEEPPEDVYNQIMERIEEIEKNGVTGGDDGGGDSDFIIRVTRDDESHVWSDKTQEEIRAAVAAGETCMALYDNGRVYTYRGEENVADLNETCPAFVGPAEYSTRDKIAFPVVYIRADKGVVLRKSNFPLPDEPGMHLVSNDKGYPVWEKIETEDDSSEVVILPETVLTADNDYSITTPWNVEPVVGSTYKVIANGVEYECDSCAGPGGIVVMGNSEALSEMLGVVGGNPDVPFIIACMDNATGDAQGGMYGQYMPLDDAESVTLSMIGEPPLTGDAAKLAALAPLVFKGSVTITGYETTFTGPGVSDLVPDTYYLVSVNGKYYECKDIYRSYGGKFQHMLGNTSLLSLNGGNLDAPFLIRVPESGDAIYKTMLSGNVELEIYNTNKAERPGSVTVTASGAAYSANPPEGVLEKCTVSTNRTYDEIYSAYLAGKYVELRSTATLGGEHSVSIILPLVYVDNDYGKKLVFSAVTNGYIIDAVCTPDGTTQTVRALTY